MWIATRRSQKKEEVPATVATLLRCFAPRGTGPATIASLPAGQAEGGKEVSLQKSDVRGKKIKDKR